MNESQLGWFAKVVLKCLMQINNSASQLKYVEILETGHVFPKLSFQNFMISKKVWPKRLQFCY